MSCSTLLWPYRLQPARLLCPQDFPRQEYWSVLPFPSPRDLPNPGLLHQQVDSLPLSHQGSPYQKTGFCQLRFGRQKLFWLCCFSGSKTTVWNHEVLFPPFLLDTAGSSSPSAKASFSHSCRPWLKTIPLAFQIIA